MDDKAFPLHEHNWHNWLVSMNGIAVERHAVERHAVVFSHGLILPSAEISAQLQPSRARKREREREREGGGGGGRGKGGGREGGGAAGGGGETVVG